ncbi:MAG: hypothetical protein RRY36_08090 [Bacteroidaceae bacterium]
MTIDEVIKNLHLYQKWRRGGLDEMPMTPKVLGETEDEAIRLLRQIRKKNKKNF